MEGKVHIGKTHGLNGWAHGLIALDLMSSRFYCSAPRIEMKHLPNHP